MESKERNIYIALGVIGLVVIVLLLGTVIVISLSGSGAPQDSTVGDASEYSEDEYYGGTSAETQYPDYTDADSTHSGSSDYADDYTTDSGSVDYADDYSDDEDLESESATKPVTTAPVTESKSSGSDKKSSSNSSSAASSDTGKTYKIGSTVDLDGVAVTLNKAYTTKEVNALFEAPAGKEYIVTNWTFQNNTDSKVDVTAMWNTTAYVDNDKVDVSGASDFDLLFSTINSGRKVSGNLVYEVPDDWQVFEVEMVDSLFSDSEPYIFRLKNR